MSAAIFTEALESRLLMSAGNTPVLDTAVMNDRAQIQIALLKFRGDCLIDSSAMLADITKIKNDDRAQLAALAPKVTQMRADLTAMWQQLRADRLAEAQNVLADESVIAGDRLAALKDKGTSAATTDHAKLITDRIKLQNDMVTGLNARIETRQADYAMIFADAQAVVVVAQSEPTVTADITRWTNDRTNCMNTMAADLQTLVNDRTQLIADLTAEQSM